MNCAREGRRGAALERIGTSEAHPAAEPANAIDTLHLERAIEELPDGFREVLLLHDVEGHTHEEIGRCSASREGTSKSQLSRARAAVRARLGERKEEPR